MLTMRNGTPPVIASHPTLHPTPGLQNLAVKSQITFWGLEWGEGGGCLCLCCRTLKMLYARGNAELLHLNAVTQCAVFHHILECGMR